MSISAPSGDNAQRSRFIQSLHSYAGDHKTVRWSGDMSDFLETVFPPDPAALARNSHQYMWDMLRWKQASRDEDGKRLFADELFGIEEPISRVMEYFKAAAAGSEVGRRLLLLLGPPSGGKSSLVILLKRGLEQYSRTEEGALYAIQKCPVHESPLHLIPHSLRQEFHSNFGVAITGELCPHCRNRLEEQYHGDLMRMPVERIFISEADRIGVGTYAPHDPSTADLADLVGSVDLSKVAEYGDEGDPRTWSWSGSVYAASRGMLEMIEILKVKREFLYLLLTLTQEKNVKVARFPLIYLDETIIAHTNLAEFRKFLQESENEALLDRMVIVQVPYTLNYKEEARIYHKLISSAAPAFRNVRLDPHVLNAAAVFSILTRIHHTDEREQDLVRKVRLHGNDESEGMSQLDAVKSKHRLPEEGLSGVSPRFVINALSTAIIRADRQSLSTMDMLLGLKDAIETDARIDAKRKRKWVDYLVITRKHFYNRWVKEDVNRAMFVSFENEAQALVEKYLDEVEAALDGRTLVDPMTGEGRKPDERFLRVIEEKIPISEAGKQSFRQEVLRKAMVAYKRGDKFTLDSHAQLHNALEQYLFDQRREVLHLVNAEARPDDALRQKALAVEQRMMDQGGYDSHTARAALNYVSTLLAQE